MQGLFNGKRPDITPAQIIAGIPLFMNVLATYGIWSPSPDEKQALADLLWWALILLGADAAIRVGRNIGDGLAANPMEPKPAQLPAATPTKAPK
jgi:hypothetical protein